MTVIEEPQALPRGPFSTIVADPPWQYNDKLINVGMGGQGAESQYRVMTPADILAMPIPALAAENAHLYLWVTNPMLRLGLDVLDAWGFTYKTTLTWIKMNKRAEQPFREDQVRMGLGRYFRGATEHILFGVRGRMMLDSASLLNVFHAPIGRHSQKPDRLFELTEAASPAPRLELFARAPRDGWSVWGDEVRGDQ